MCGLSGFCNPCSFISTLNEPVTFIALSDSVCVCLAVASASLAAGISQSRDRTCCLSACRVAIVTTSASLRCFWETIPHPDRPVWVPAKGCSFFFFLPSRSTDFFFVCSLLCLLSFRTHLQS